MKKIISILLALIMLTALAVPALAVTTFSENQTINGGNYPDGIRLCEGTTLTIEGTVEISAELRLEENSTLIISRNAKLIGKDLKITARNNSCKIEVYGINDGNNVTNGTEGKIDITTDGGVSASALAAILDRSGCTYRTQGSTHFLVGDAASCAHEHTTIKTTTETTTTTTTQTTTTTTFNTICEDCEDVLKTEVKTETGEPQVTTTTSTDSGTASILSEGNMTIVVGVACSAVFLVVGFILGRKKLKTED